jgi:hypothetical protein
VALRLAATRGGGLPRPASAGGPAGRDAREITDEDVAAWRGEKYSDHCLLHLLAYDAIIAAG